MTFREFDIFINAPFDDDYKAIFDSITYAIVRYGYRVRCALEVSNAAENRFSKICGIISECKFGIHDISRTETDGTPPLPRFNMPLELGLFLGATRFGSGKQKTKSCIIFDREQYRYQRFISDIAGQDIYSHKGDPKEAVLQTTAWLRGLPGGVMPGGGASIWTEYKAFLKKLKAICKADNMLVSELKFQDFNILVAKYIATL